ncbi:MAG: hypothetical protein ACRCZY_03035 [Phocaeicola sp.]
MAPTFVILISILLNYLVVIAVGENTKKRVNVRIAPICNGKIYLLPTANRSSREESYLDLPINEFLAIRMKEVSRCADNICLKYQKELLNTPLPRFNLKYTNKESLVLLYILPLKSEKQINFRGGLFVEPKDILTNPQKYSPILVEEAGHLETTTEMWKLFG